MGQRASHSPAERHCLEESDVQRAGYYLYDNYTAYFPGFGPLADVRNAQLARDYETIQWQGIQFEVVPLPGHTFGQAGYVFEIDGQRCLACGDVAPGKLGDYYWLQWKYMDFQGHVNQLESLAQVAALDVDLILPGHGAPFAKPTPASTSSSTTWPRFTRCFTAGPTRLSGRIPRALAARMGSGQLDGQHLYRQGRRRPRSPH